MFVKKLKKEIAESRAYENMLANVAKQDALIDYIFMMADIDLPSSETESEVESDE
jgi:hypothetical protein